MPNRRDFLRAALLGAAAAALVGCAAREDEEDSLEGIQPIKYGDQSSQLAELLLPNAFGPFPVVVLIHGGWWRTGWDRRGNRALARDLVKQGYATWNLEYRLVGEEGGGFPGTFEDIAAGIDLLARKAIDYNLDLGQVIFIGHSAGGQLALWAAARDTFPPNSLGSDPQVMPKAVVAAAPVADLIGAANQNLGDGAVQALLGGGPLDVPFSYLATSPTELVPILPPQVLLHSVTDEIVPIEQSRTYVAAATAAGSEVELVELESGGHFDVIDPENEAWIRLRDRLPEFMSGDLDVMPTIPPD